MRISIYLAVLNLIASASATADAVATKTSIELPVTFTPPAVFKNNNLVRIVSLEKNYARETVNVQVQNIDKKSQDEYFLAFDASKFPQIGGLEVKNKKDANSSAFIITPVNYNAANDIQYYQIKFPSSLEAGEQLTLGITYNVLKAFKPLPATIAQDEPQFLKFDFSAYFQSPYETAKQKTELKFPSTRIPDYTEIKGSTAKQGQKIVYGPFEDQPANSAYPASARYEFTKPILHVKTLDRDVEVSHWGGNIAFEENYDLYHRGANLSSLFNRAKWAHSSYQGIRTYALTEFTFDLPIGAQNPYYTDIIGNVSTSHFRSNMREALLQAKPRYPIFGGWKYPFTVGWNSEASDFLRTTASDGYLLAVPIFNGPTQAEGVEYENVNIQVLLPEGAENVRYYTNLPDSSIKGIEVTKVRTYLDTVGRTAVLVKAENLVDDFRGRQLFISYDYSATSALRKPLVIFGSAFSVFVATYILFSIDLSLAKTSRKSN